MALSGLVRGHTWTYLDIVGILHILGHTWTFRVDEKDYLEIRVDDTDYLEIRVNETDY